MAHAVSMFALLPAYRLVPADRPPGAGGAALRAGGIVTAEAAQTGGVRGAVRPAARRDRAPVRRLPLPAAECRVRSPDPLARAAEAADLAGPPDHPTAHRR